MNRSSKSVQWMVVPLVAASLLAAPQAAHSQRRGSSARERAVVGQLISVEVRVDGHWVPLHRAPGIWDRHYFEAERNENYALRIRNRTGRRVGVLVSVDGLNVVSGERSAQSPHESMYVLDPRESTTIRGWRTSLDDVREFVFVDEQRSYASRTGQANGDMGWIRVLAFEEQEPVARYRQDKRWNEREFGSRDDDARSEAAPPAAPPEAVGKAKDEMAQDERAPQSLDKEIRGGRESFPGTGWGDKRRDRVRETWFVPVAYAGDNITLRYEYEQALADLGIDIGRDCDRLDARERGEWRFAQPPRR